MEHWRSSSQFVYINLALAFIKGYIQFISLISCEK